MRAVLLIVDGMGYSKSKIGNAVTAETMPFFFKCASKNGMALLDASEEAVGLAKGQSGNSEVGHLSIGAGVRCLSRSEVIANSFKSGDWKSNTVWKSIPKDKPLHIYGLLSQAGIHGHIDNLWKSAQLAFENQIQDINIHVALDGVDSQAASAPQLLEYLNAKIAQIPGAKLATIMGRRWAMDRGGRIDVSEVFFQHLTGKAKTKTFTSALLAEHISNFGSEWDFPSHHMLGAKFISLGDTVLITNHRADRTIQLAQLLALQFKTFSLGPLATAVDLEHVFFPEKPLSRGLITELKKMGTPCERIAEQCKFPHVTFFMNGFHKSHGEKAICIPSISDTEIAGKPEMSLAAITEALVRSVKEKTSKALIVNIANLDQVGHLGNYELVAQVATLVDQHLELIANECKKHDWNLIITSDHGNADQMLSKDNKPFGSHSLNPVPFVFVPANEAGLKLKLQNGSLANVAASFIQALGKEAPTWMEKGLLEQEKIEGEIKMIKNIEKLVDSCCLTKREQKLIVYSVACTLNDEGAVQYASEQALAEGVSESALNKVKEAVVASKTPVKASLSASLVNALKSGCCS